MLKFLFIFLFFFSIIPIKLNNICFSAESENNYKYNKKYPKIHRNIKCPRCGEKGVIVFKLKSYRIYHCDNCNYFWVKGKLPEPYWNF